MLSIRLKRIGRKKHPFYNIIISEKLTYIKGKYIEKLGYFDPIAKKKSINIERINYWLKNGAILSKTMQSIIKTNKKDGFS